MAVSMINGGILKSLDEFNQSISNVISDYNNGIACPSCGSELFDVANGKIAFIDNHNQKPICCHNCSYTGYRYI